jgi:hypothetical protein
MLDSFNPAWIAAAAAVCTALIAWRASSNWRKGLENERIDNALSALHDLDARIDRVVALRGDKEHVWNALAEPDKTPRRFAQKVRCAIYTRKSTDEGLEQAFNSLDAQREACAAGIKTTAGRYSDRPD